MKEIPLTAGYSTWVDDSDFRTLSGNKWHAAIRGRSVYAGRHECGKYILMHREILCLSGSLMADHINGDGLDNRRSNLRTATKAQNAINSKIPTNNTSGYKGVSFRANRWDAYIFVNQRKIHLGRFRSRTKADNARRIAEKQYFGQFARI